MQTGGRIYGLAAALAVGAAVAAGHGTAYADAPDDTGSKPAPARSESAAPVKHPKSPASRPGERPEAGSRISAAAPAAEQNTAAPTPSMKGSPHFERVAAIGDHTRLHRKTQPLSRPATPKWTRDDVHLAARDAAPAIAMPAAVTVDVPTPAATPTLSPAPAPSPPAETSTATLTRVGTTGTDRATDDLPAAPAQTALLGVLAGFARQESTRAARTNLIAVDAVTTGLVDDDAQLDTALAVSQAAAPDPLPVEQTRVPVATTRVAPFEFLQHIPILGRLIVTPIVAFLHQIPLVSDLIHPWVGFPVDHDAPAGAAPTRDVSVTSFDGIRINTHFMPAEGLLAGQSAPTVLYGPGLAMPGATNIDGTLLDGMLADMVGMMSIGKLREAGYNVVTWDPRGEFLSRGRMQMDSPDFEARDVSSIISWVASLPEAQLDSAAALDPRLGMVGVSYGGGIQLVTAGVDKRVDAIVPTIAWNSLNTTLNKSGSPKTSWALILTAGILFSGGRPNPQIFASVFHGALTGQLTQTDINFLTDRSAGALSAGRITAPTLLIQGTVDTLFSLQETDAIAQVLLANGVDTKVLWFCGGHGLCTNTPFDPSDGRIIEARTMEWLDRYVKGNTSVSTGPAFEWVDQHGQWYSSNTYQLPQAAPIVVTGGAGKTLPLIPIAAGSGFLPLVPWAAKARNAVNLTIPAVPTTTYVVGAPQLTLTYSGTGSSRFVYAQLVDDSTGLVLGTQVTPVPVTLDGQTNTVTVSLEPVAATLAPGQTVTLQLVAESGTYVDLLPSVTELFAGGKLHVTDITLTLPSAAAAAVTVTAG